MKDDIKTFVAFLAIVFLYCMVVLASSKTPLGAAILLGATVTLALAAIMGLAVANVWLMAKTLSQRCS